MSSTSVSVPKAKTLAASKHWYPIVVFLATLLVHIPLVFSGFDFHHNGLMMAAAIAVRDGLDIHREVFSQYGPVTAWSQSIFLHLPFDEAISLGLWAAIVTAGIAATLAAIPQAYRGSSSFSAKVGLVAAGLWIALSPSFQLATIQAWSSLLGSFLSVGAVYAGARAINGQISGQSRVAFVSWLGAGLLVGLLPFTRLNAGLATVFLLLIWSLSQLQNRVQRQASAFFWLGHLLSAVAVLLILVASQGLASYWLQSVLGPLDWAINESRIDSFLRHNLGFLEKFLPRAFPIALLSVVPLILSMRWTINAHLRVILKIIAVGFAAISLAYGVGLQQEVTTVLSEGVSDRTMALAMPRITMFLAWVLGASIAVVSMRVLTSLRKTSLSRQTFWVFILCVGLGSVVQFYPLGDAFHLWWGGPIMLLLGVASFRALIPTGAVLIAPVGLFLLFFQSHHVLQALENHTVLGPAGTPLASTYMTQAAADYSRSLADMYNATSIGESGAVFRVHGGIETVMTGVYVAEGEYFTAWSLPNETLDELKLIGNTFVVDYLSLESIGFDSFQELAEEIDAEISYCSSYAEPYYNPSWDSSEPYICVLESSYPPAGG